MGRAQKLKQQRRDEERLKQLEKHAKREKALLWSIIGTLIACVVALVLVAVLVKLPTYVKQMVVEVTGKGTFIVEMREDDAPETCAHIEAMVRNGTYKGSSFYQVDETFVLTGITGRDQSAYADSGATQAARALDDGAGTVVDEIKLPNVRGAVGMAKPSDPSTGKPVADSGSNEFYILKQDTPSLDPDFTIFGMVTEGMDVVDGLGLGEAITSFSLDESGRYVTIEQGTGRIVIELKPEDAPQTVQHFTGLIDSGFYEGMNWYRVEDFVVQTGSHARSLEATSPNVLDPAMLEEEAREIPDEFKLPMVRGAAGIFTISDEMAQQMGTGAPGQTEFFVLKKDMSETVQTGYTVFGEVVEGMDVVDLIQQGDTIATIYIREVRKD